MHIREENLLHLVYHWKAKLIQKHPQRSTQQHVEYQGTLWTSQVDTKK